jgi:xanthine dehydrogenase small subunit
VGLWINKQHQHFEQIIDLTQVRELQHISVRENTLHIGAGVNLEDAFEAIIQERASLRSYCHRFAGLLVRRSATLGGNIANGSPIGDSMPLLIALKARIVLSRQQGSQLVHRELALEDFYKAYRVKDLGADEVLTEIMIPRPSPGEWVVAYKISKRQEDDISAVAMSIRTLTDTQGKLTDVSIGLGGVAAVPAKARLAEQALLQHGWTATGIEAAQHALLTEFSPLSDLRASQAYRQKMLHNLLYRAWLESSPNTHPTLEQLS